MVYGIAVAVGITVMVGVVLVVLAYNWGYQDGRHSGWIDGCEWGMSLEREAQDILPDVMDDPESEVDPKELRRAVVELGLERGP